MHPLVALLVTICWNSPPSLGGKLEETLPGTEIMLAAQVQAAQVQGAQVQGAQVKGGIAWLQQQGADLLLALTRQLVLMEPELQVV